MIWIFRWHISPFPQVKFTTNTQSTAQSNIMAMTSRWLQSQTNAPKIKMQKITFTLPSKFIHLWTTAFISHSMTFFCFQLIFQEERNTFLTHIIPDSNRKQLIMQIETTTTTASTTIPYIFRINWQVWCEYFIWLPFYRLIIPKVREKRKFNVWVILNDVKFWNEK